MHQVPEKIGAVSLALVIALSCSARVFSEEINIDIKQQSLVSALDQLSQQTHLQFIYSGDYLSRIEAVAISGRMEKDVALQELLKGTGLGHKYISDNMVLVTALKIELVNSTSIAPLNDNSIEEVISIGTALANRTAIVIKERSQQIMDVYSADDIGSLPELNVADSFRRIVGLNTIMGGTDDEGQFVTVRGISAGGNFTTFDGMAMATDTEDTRGVNLEAIPGSAVNGIEVYKSSTPDLDGHGLGGHMNMISRSAYDRSSKDNDGRYFQIDIDSSKYSRNATPNDGDKIGYGLSLIYSDILGRDDQFGLVIGVKTELIDRDTMRSDGGTRYLSEDTSQDYPLVRKRFGAYNDSKTKEKKGGIAKFEWLTEQFYAYFNTYYYEKEDDDTSLLWSVLSNTTTAQNADGSGGGEQGLGTIEVYNRVTTTDSGGLHFHIDTTLDDMHEVNFDVSRSVANYSRPFFQSYWDTVEDDSDDDNDQYRAEMGYTYEDDSYYPSWQFNDPAYASDGANYQHRETQLQTRDSKDEVTEIRTDYKFNLNRGDYGWGVGSGIKLRNNKRKNNGNRYDYSTIAGSDLFVSDFQTADYFVPEYFSSPQPILDNKAYMAYFNNNIDLFDDVSDTRSIERFDYSFDEDVSAVYLLGRFAFERGEVLAGFRYEKTQMTSDGTHYDFTQEVFVPVSVANNYDDLLPSINFSWNITQELRFRAAISKTIGRPDPEDFKAISLFNEKNGVRTISTNNQNLSPRSSDNFDVAAEYYFDGVDAIASMALFAKKIKNLPIRSTTSVQVDDIGADGAPITEIRYKNIFNSDNAEISGIELNFVQNSLWFLPAMFHRVGISTNVTFMESEIAYINVSSGESEVVDHLLEQPDFIANAMVFYKFMGGRGEARIAYQYTGQYSAELQLNGDSREEQYYKSYEQFDFNLRYEVTDNTIIKFKVRNLTDSSRLKVEGNDHNIFKSETTFGRSFWVGLTYKI